MQCGRFNCKEEIDESKNHVEITIHTLIDISAFYCNPICLMLHLAYLHVKKHGDSALDVVKRIIEEEE